MEHRRIQEYVVEKAKMASQFIALDTNHVCRNGLVVITWLSFSQFFSCFK